MLAQMGQVNRETAEIILQSLGGADAALRGALEAAIVEALKNEEPALRKAAQQGLLNGPGVLPPEVTPNQMLAFSLYYRQSADKLNLVNTVMLESTEAAYQATVADAAARIARTQSILNTGAGEVVTGVSAWNTAMHDTVAQMVQNGLTGFIDHAGRQWSPEAYVAMDIRTTMFNTAREAVWERNEAYGNDLYQVSSHNGARPGCYPWQGKVISKADAERDVVDLYGETVHVYPQSATTYGEAAGLFGVNCRHYPMAFIPGFSTIKGQPQDPEENAKVYEQSQTQRALERKLRYEKRNLSLMQAQGASEGQISAQRAKVRQASADIDAFCDETGRARRRNREFTPVNPKWPAEGSYDPATFPTETRDRMNDFFGGRAAAVDTTPEAPAQTSGIRRFDFTPAKTVEEAEDYARRFLQSEKYGSVSYKGIDVEYANTCNRVLNDVYSQYTPKYRLKQIAPMNPRSKEFRDVMDSADAAYQASGEGSIFINPRFYKSAKTYAAHMQDFEDVTGIIREKGQKLLDTGRYTGVKKAQLEAVLRTGRQTVCESHDFFEGAIVHESGHMLDDKLFRRVMKAIDSPLSKMGAIGESRATFGGGISGYAVTDNNEYIAESFTAWWYGEVDKLDPELVRIFEEAKTFDAG